jgi:alcohol dehydrogenase class IV
MLDAQCAVMMRSFLLDQPACRVIFGAGSIAQLSAEVERLGARRALIVSTAAERPLAEDAARRLGRLTAGFFSDAVMHHPIETVQAARDRALAVDADCCVTIGGGTTTGTGKVIALETGMPVIAVPTTYAGSEMTPIYGITEGTVKRTGRDRKVLPRTVIYDPELTLSLPPEVSGPSGINALAHSIEGLYAHDTNPITVLMAEESIRALSRSLPAVVRTPADIDARSEALYGAWLAGIVLGGTAMGLHHKLCHTLGGTFNLPHAEVHTVILPHAIAYNREFAPEAMQRAAAALSAADAAQGAFDLAVSLGAKTSLAQLGMSPEGLDRAADLAVQNQYPNPRPLERDAIRQLLENAYAGTRPEPGKA